MPKRLKCVKCGSDKLTVSYQVGKRKDVTTKNQSEDCLIRKCMSCGYSWEEPCEDAK